jgi:hypothetical protein
MKHLSGRRADGGRMSGSQVKIDTLSGEFDALLVRMQTLAARAGMQAAFDASPKQLGKAAVALARKRGRTPTRTARP